jgi:DNA-binding protein HU-beta
MNKSALIDEVRKLLAGDTTRAAAERATAAVIAAMKRGLRRDGEVAVAGFGTFNVAKLPARRGFNPHTRRPMRISAVKTVRFRPAAELRARC